MAGQDKEEEGQVKFGVRRTYEEEAEESILRG